MSRYLWLFILSCCLGHRGLHSFPTRRSSDLSVHLPAEWQHIRPAVRAAAPPPPLLTTEELSAKFTELTRRQIGEHTSELQSRGHLVCRLLLEKKNTVDIPHDNRMRRKNQQTS